MALNATNKIIAETIDGAIIAANAAVSAGLATSYTVIETEARLYTGNPGYEVVLFDADAA